MTQNTLPDEVLHLEELEILVVVDNETDTLSSVDEGVPQIPEVAHLAAAEPQVPRARMQDRIRPAVLRLPRTLSVAHRSSERTESQRAF
jgi:hypothetical protein